MWTDFPLFPESASSISDGVDLLFWILVAVTLLFSTLIFVVIFYFAIKYRRQRPDEIPRPILGSLKLEVFWSVTPGVIALALFGWGTYIYFRNADPPAGATEMYVVGKQWMWKLQHPEGQREINELHVPVGRPVRLTMATEDVITVFTFRPSGSRWTSFPAATLRCGSSLRALANTTCSAPSIAATSIPA